MTRQHSRPGWLCILPTLVTLAFFALIFTDRLRQDLLTTTLRATSALFPYSSSSDPLQLNPHFDRSPPQPRIRTFDWTITRGLRHPDSVERLVYLVNGIYPGPTIEANVGDTIRVRIRNALRPDERGDNEEEHNIYTTKVHHVHPRGTDANLSLHWHGVGVRGTPRADGAVGFNALPIAPGGEHIYEFVLGKADAGTHWWHSHLGMSRADGLWGFLVVHDAASDATLAQALAHSSKQVVGHRLDSNPTRPWDGEQLLALGDHFHKPAPVSLGWYLSRFSIGREPVPDNGLINGYNIFDCSRLLYEGLTCRAERGRMTESLVEPGRTYRLRIVNTGAIGVQTFSIDNHNLTVIEADGTLVEPFTVSRLPVIPGQRYSVLIHTDALVANSKGHQEFWIRSSMHPECFNMPNPALEMETKAVLRYSRSSRGFGEAFRSWWWKTHGAADELKRDSDEITKLSASSLPLARNWSRRSPEPSTSPMPEPTNFELDPCRDLPLPLLRPLRTRRSDSSPSDLSAPDFDGSRGERRIILYAASPKMDKNGLVPMAVMNRTSWRWGAHINMEDDDAGDQASEAERGAGDSLLDRLAPLIWPSSGPTSWKGSVHELLASSWDSRNQLVVPILPRLGPSPTTTDEDHTATVEVILHNLDDDPHPFHLHGHKFAVLYRHGPTLSRHTWREDEPPTQAGWDASYELRRPVWRDTVSVPERGFVVLRWKADNPGVWALHCHTLVHHMAGEFLWAGPS
ncbi:hypothetical protein V8E36_009757 [Tilletia maclaganii]